MAHLMQPGLTLGTFSPSDPVPDDILALIVPTASDIQQLPPEIDAKNLPILCWDVMDWYLSEISWQIYCSAEQYYLRYALEKACKPSTDTVFLGSSYAKYGLSALEFGDSCVNLGLDAQDVYYSCKLAEKVTQQNPRLQNIVFASGYYWFYSDISRATSAYAKDLIKDTYYPILKDAHHAKRVETSEGRHVLPEDLSFLDESKVLEDYCKKHFENLCGQSAKVTRRFTFNQTNGWSIWNRYLRVPSSRTDPSKLSWSMLSGQVKNVFAQARCMDHNKLLRHAESYEENKAILNSFISLCNQKQIHVYILCMPQTEYYLRHLDPRFKQTYFAALDSIDGVYHFMDFHDTGLFQPEDFIDQDHLSSSGAKKTTSIIKELIDTCRS